MIYGLGLGELRSGLMAKHDSGYGKLESESNYQAWLACFNMLLAHWLMLLPLTLAAIATAA